MIKAVIFDWGGVLIDNPALGLTAYCAGHLGVSEVRFGEAQEKFEGEFQKGTISEDVFWERVCSELGVVKPNTRSLWGDAFRGVYSEKTRIFSLCSFLKDKGYRIGFLSNTELPAVEYFHEQGYAIFDVTVFSCIEGTRKPERRIYEIALERLSLKPEETIFIDDRDDYIAGARTIGMNAILFEDEEQVFTELQSLLGHSLKKAS